MNKLFKLNLQLFAEPGEGDSGGNSGNEPGAQGGNTQIDYSKIEEIVNKRSSQTQDSVLKGYLKQQGLSGEELNQAITNYKEQKQQAALQAKQEQENIKLENQKLKAQILNSNIDTKLASLAAAEGINADKISFLAKLIDRDGLADEKGNVLEDKVKEALNAVVKAFPDFKGNSQHNGGGFQQIGSGGSDSKINTVDDKLDAIFGVKKK
ncbi:MAG: hypothetical protein ACLRO0_09385 [Massilimicrobiota timonensis]